MSNPTTVFTLNEMLDKWKSRRDTHRQKRDFLQQHDFTLEASFENGIYLELDTMIIDLEIAIQNDPGFNPCPLRT